MQAALHALVWVYYCSSGSTPHGRSCERRRAAGSVRFPDLIQRTGLRMRSLIRTHIEYLLYHEYCFQAYSNIIEFYDTQINFGKILLPISPEYHPGNRDPWCTPSSRQDANPNVGTSLTVNFLVRGNGSVVSVNSLMHSEYDHAA